MKKVFLAFAVASIFAACSDSSTTTDTTKDSTGVMKDTSGMMTSPADTSMMKDTMHIKMDTTGKNHPGTKDTVIKK